MKLELLKFEGVVDLDVLDHILKNGNELTFNKFVLDDIFLNVKKNFRLQAHAYKRPDGLRPFEIDLSPETIEMVYHIKDKVFYSGCIWNVLFVVTHLQHWQRHIMGMKISPAGTVVRFEKMAEKDVWHKLKDDEIIDMKKLFDNSSKLYASIRGGLDL